MPTSRVTMQDVARAAGVHQTTVSLALRNDPRLPARTRSRVRAVARQLQYRPDPMLSALNFYRASRHAVKAPPPMAFLLNFADARELAASHPHRMFLEGARHQAEQLGYHLDVFFVGHGPDAGAQLQRVLRARGITGVILAAFADKTIEFNLDWRHFSTVLIESHQLRLPLHTISNHQEAVTREAIRRLRRLGYQRIGLAVGEREEVYLQNAFTAGYYVETAQWPDLAAVPPLIIPPQPPAEIAGLAGPWIRRHALEVVISNWANFATLLRLAGLRPPRDVVVASLDVVPGDGPSAGMRQNHRIVGERAVEQLASLMRSNVRGLMDTPNTTLIEGCWVNGPGVPRRGPAPPGSRKRLRAILQ
jgi:LacI family transcriptional regulator